MNVKTVPDNSWSGRSAGFPLWSVLQSPFRVIRDQNYKKYISGLILFTLLFHYNSQAGPEKDSLLLKGHLKGQENEKVFLSFTDAEGKLARYQVTAKDGRFLLRVKKQPVPVRATLSTAKNRNLTRTENETTYSSPSRMLDLFIYQSDIEIKGSADQLFLSRIKGDKENNELNKYKLKVRKWEENNARIHKKLFYQGTGVDSLRFKRLYAQSLSNGKKITAVQKQFIQKNPASLTSLFLLGRMEIYYSSGDYEAAFEQLSDKYKRTDIGQRIQKRLDFLAPTAVGKMAINFKKNDKDGKVTELKDFKGKIVLLDFWGSWCGPCRASHPHLRKLYEQYKHKGFEIIAIAQQNHGDLATRRQKWLEAIEKDKINWVHVMNDDEDGTTDIIAAYRITAFPTKILLDKDGKILMRISASATDDIDKKLETLLGK